MAFPHALSVLKAWWMTGKERGEGGEEASFASLALAVGKLLSSILSFLRQLQSLPWPSLQDPVTLCRKSVEAEAGVASAVSGVKRVPCRLMCLHLAPLGRALGGDDGTFGVS